jgi:cephalosporin-C deacetylase
VPLFDKPLSELQTFRAPDFEPEDFDAFWKMTLKEAAAHPLAVEFAPVREPIYRTVDVEDVTFNGFGGQPVKGWFIAPRKSGGGGGGKSGGKLPCVVTYLGYGGGRSLPVDHLAFASAGIANFITDTRGQGSVWAPGSTPDDAPPGSAGPHVPGFMTLGVESPRTYYYRRVFTDAVRAVQAAAAHPRVDAKRLAVTGASQGGGTTIAVAALCGKAVKLAMPDVPFLCYYRRASEIVDTLPYAEIATYLKTHRNRKEQVFRTLAYFDGVNFAPRITARCLFSVGQMDNICPPSTVFAAYNRVKAKKEIRVYDYNNHEGGGVFQVVERLRFAEKYL